MNTESQMPILMRGAWIGATSLFVAAMLLYGINLGRPPHPDELHHVLAAQRLMETGIPAIAEGEYWRGILYTWLVAISYEAFGEGLTSARLPAVVLVALVVPILFLWVRREAGPLAAWISAILFASSPFTVEIAQFTRFYSIQILSFVLGTICLYYSMAPGHGLLRRMFLGALVVALFSLACWQQVTTIMGLAGIAAWLLAIVVTRLYILRRPARWIRVGGILAAAIVAAGVVVVAMVYSEEWLWAWERYRSTPLFAARHADDFWFYHLRFYLFYPTLWTLIGFAAILAILHSPRLAWLAIVVFGVSFVLASFAAQKGTRYFCYAQPFLAIIWGLGLAHVMKQLPRFMDYVRSRFVERLPFAGRTSARFGRSLMVAALAIVLLTNPFWLRTATVIGNVALPFDTPATDWSAAREALAPWTATADIMITTEELGAIYFLGRSDVRYSPNKLPEIRPDQRFEFGIDHRTGRPIIAKPESVERLIECFDRGIVVGPIEHWGEPILIGETVQEILRRHAQPIDVPRKSHLYAWGWSRERGGVKPAHCSELERFSGLTDVR